MSNTPNEPDNASTGDRSFTFLMPVNCKLAANNQMLNTVQMTIGVIRHLTSIYFAPKPVNTIRNVRMTISRSIQGEKLLM